MAIAPGEGYLLGTEKVVLHVLRKFGESLNIFEPILEQCMCCEQCFWMLFDPCLRNLMEFCRLFVSLS